MIRSIARHWLMIRYIARHWLMIRSIASSGSSHLSSPNNAAASRVILVLPPASRS